MGIIQKLSNVIGLKSASPDWGTLERFISWAFGGGASASGIVVTPQTAMQAGTVYSCVNVLAQSISMLPCKIYQSNNGNISIASEHPVYKLFSEQPNDWQTPLEFFEMLVASLCLRGNAYAYINRTDSGRIVELLPLHPDMVRVEMGSGFRLSYSITMPDGTFKNLIPGEIFHIRGMTLNGWLGISPIAYARESIGLALATEKFGSQIFRNGAKMGGVLEYPGKLTKESYDRIKQTFDEASSGENAHKTAILEEGMKFAKISMTADDSQFLETRKYQRSEIAAIFRVPPHMIGDLERATFSNIEQQSLGFITYTLMPWLTRFEQAIKRDLLLPKERSQLHVKFNVAALLRGDAAARSTYYHNGIQDGWMTRNEARSTESEIGNIFNPIDGLDIPLMPLNMTDGTDDPDEAIDTGKEPKKLN